MYKGPLVSITLDASGIAELILDTPDASANVMSTAMQNDLRKAVDVLAASSDVKALMISSAKSTFFLGANINEFLEAFKKPAAEISEWSKIVHQLFLDIESLPFPTLAAVNGMAVGGGTELSLSTDFVIADSKAQIGLPEVTLGICPGWGGTVRLPRIIGIEAAAQWMMTGKPVKAPKVLEQGYLHAVVEDAEALREKGLEVLQAAIAGKLDYKTNRDRKQTALPDNEETAQQIAAMKASWESTLDPNYPAPIAILDLLSKSPTTPFLEALDMEMEVFGQLCSGEVASNLVTVFLNSQLVKRNTRVWSKQASPVRTAAVLGAGIMGGGIAYQSALSGTPIVMKDIAEKALDLGVSTAADILDRSIKKGRMTEEKKQTVLANIQPTLDNSTLSNVDCVVEAVVEREDVKKQVLAEVEKIIPESAVLASNTSTISIDTLAEALDRPEQFCGMHFFNPVHAMPLVEVIRGSKTSDATVATTVAYASAMGKTPIVVNNCPGFLVNRVLFPYFNAFNRLLMDGVDFERIDSVMETYGWPMGPAYLADVVGLDTMVHADRVMVEGFPERMSHEEQPIIETLVEQGALGQKNGEGFYAYSKDSSGKRVKAPSEKVKTILQQRVTRSIDISDEDILHRMMIPMCLEVALCVEEGIVQDPAEADMGLLLGLGFPRFRGGALKFIDNLGLEAFGALVEKHQASGPLYALGNELKQRIKDNKSFY